MNNYTIEIVIPFNGGFPDLPHSTLNDDTNIATTKFYDIHSIVVPEQHLGITIARLDAACDEHSISTYHFEQQGK